MFYNVKVNFVLWNHEHECYDLLNLCIFFGFIASFACKEKKSQGNLGKFWLEELARNEI